MAKTVVITGGTRGIGLGLADAFLRFGYNVAICGRSRETAERAAAQMGYRFRPDRVLGMGCDVSKFEQVQALWDGAVQKFGKVDVWINNAGMGQSIQSFHEIQTDSIKTLVFTNVLGAMYGCKVALTGMRKQGNGAIYNMEGFGSDGRILSGLSLYGASKYGLAYLTNALARECRGLPVIMCGLRPGMVVTDLLAKGYEPGSVEEARAKRIFNILADKVETVAPWLALKIMENKKNGVRIRWLTGRKAAWRFASARVRRRSVIE